jgi:chromosome segregation ATPase
VDVKDIIQDFEKKIKSLKLEVDNLSKRKANFLKDVESLRKEKTELEGKVNSLSKVVAQEVNKAMADAEKRITTLEDDLRASKIDLDRERGRVNCLLDKAQEKNKKAENLKESLKARIDECNRKEAELDEKLKKIKDIIELAKNVE